MQCSELEASDGDVREASEGNGSARKARIVGPRRYGAIAQGANFRRSGPPRKARLGAGDEQQLDSEQIEFDRVKMVEIGGDETRRMDRGEYPEREGVS